MNKLILSRFPSLPYCKYLRIIWRIVLDDPVYEGNIESSGGNVGAEQSPFSRVTKLEESLRSFALLLLAVNAGARKVHVVQQLVVELHAHARGQEHHHLGWRGGGGKGRGRSERRRKDRGRGEREE